MQFGGAGKIQVLKRKEGVKGTNAGVKSIVEAEDQLNGSTSDYDLACKCLSQHIARLDCRWYKTVRPWSSTQSSFGELDTLLVKTSYCGTRLILLRRVLRALWTVWRVLWTRSSARTPRRCVESWTCRRISWRRRTESW